jgi:hypothetical protein
MESAPAGLAGAKTMQFYLSSEADAKAGNRDEMGDIPGPKSGMSHFSIW